MMNFRIQVLNSMLTIIMFLLQTMSLLTFKFNRQAIQHLVRTAQPAALGQAA